MEDVRAQCDPRLPPMKRPLPLLLLASLLLPLAASGAETQLDNVGKLAIVTKACSRNLDAQPPQGCARLMLDQIQSNLLAVRFIARGEHPDASNQLTFAGNSKGALNCRFNRCSFNGPVELELSSLSEVIFDRNGVAEGLPKAWPVVGTCRIDASSVSCSARAIQGERWEATASY